MAGKAAKKAPSVSEKPIAARVSKKKAVPGGSRKKPITKESVARSAVGECHIVDWTSGELQSQIGKKKLVMEVWFEFFRNLTTIGGGYKWSVQYRLRSEDKNVIGSGWHTVSQLSSLTYNFIYNQPNTLGVAKSATLPLGGQSDVTAELFGGTAGSAADLPVFQTKHATGGRYGGPSGIQIVW